METVPGLWRMYLHLDTFREALQMAESRIRGKLHEVPELEELA
jgi:hypothetical protein